MNREINQASKVKNSYSFELDSQLKLVVCYYIDAQYYQNYQKHKHKNMDRFGKFGK
jgi:hypothetical protein